MTDDVVTAIASRLTELVAQVPTVANQQGAEAAKREASLIGRLGGRLVDCSYADSDGQQFSPLVKSINTLVAQGLPPQVTCAFASLLSEIGIKFPDGSGSVASSTLAGMIDTTPDLPSTVRDISLASVSKLPSVEQRVVTRASADASTLASVLDISPSPLDEPILQAFAAGAPVLAAEYIGSHTTDTVHAPIHVLDGLVTAARSLDMQVHASIVATIVGLLEHHPEQSQIRVGDDIASFLSSGRADLIDRGAAAAKGLRSNEERRKVAKAALDRLRDPSVPSKNELGVADTAVALHDSLNDSETTQLVHTLFDELIRKTEDPAVLEFAFGRLRGLQPRADVQRENFTDLKVKVEGTASDQVRSVLREGIESFRPERPRKDERWFWSWFDGEDDDTPPEEDA